MTKPFYRHSRDWIFTIMLALALASLGSCGDDSNPTENNLPGSPTRVSVPIEAALNDIQVLANQSTQVIVTLQVPPVLGSIQSAELDVAATMQHVTVSNIIKAENVEGIVSMATGQAASTAFIRVGNDPATVCQQGVLYGPYEISPTFLSEPSPEKITLDDPTVQILNAGSVVICMDIFASVNADFSVDQLEIDVTSAECESPVDFSGVWSGTYQCGNSCGGAFGDTVQIVVTQNGNTASYTDLAGDTYTGTVCGNLFRFERVDPDEIERGTLILDDASHATKRSTWRERNEPYCTGDCIDNLTRVSSKK